LAAEARSGGQVQGGDAEVLPIGQLSHKAPQVAALKALLLGGTPPGAPRHALWRRAAHTAGDAIGEELREDGVRDPRRWLDGHAGLWLPQRAGAPTIPTMVR
jgi:hypothetical protein